MNAYKFCEFAKIVSFFNPLTPCGRVYRENLPFYSDAAELKIRHAGVSAALDFIKKKKIKADRVKYHLKNVPYIDFSKKELDITDLFLYKKFLNNFRQITLALGKKENDFFKTGWDSDELLSLISADSKDDTFYLADSHDPELAAVRKEIASVSKGITEHKKEFFPLIKKETGLDFSDLDFLVIPANKKAEIKQELVNLDPYDSSSLVAKPRFGEKYFELSAKRDALIRTERELEAKIISRITGKIFKNLEKIKLYLEAVASADIAFAAADMALKLGLSEPALNSGELECKGAFFIPLKMELEKMNIRYTPLNFRFSRRLNIISGSNMGGKTVVLKTLAQLQLMAQSGFFVPAEKFRSGLFAGVFFNGSPEENIAGLSGFGMEINDFIDICSQKGGPVMIFMDEFGKTTNVLEAEALVSAILENFSGSEGKHLFLSTHFSNIKLPRNADFLAMKGFNKEKFNRYFGEMKTENLKEKLKMINRYMDYELVKMKEQKIFFDALNIAGILGLPKDIFEKALRHMEEKDENGKKQAGTLKS
ncbi:MAG: hypothetical protein COT17_08590 [Elusimicrobia bacterium CG08_land_8_20_14_0_20_51_18]|nr:MAG: hypothetical protein COT17_08590 [Elusimicrobia bacterium CG08_land_8_20_14_0_20_51_18]